MTAWAVHIALAATLGLITAGLAWGYGGTTGLAWGVGAWAVLLLLYYWYGLWRLMRWLGSKDAGAMPRYGVWAQLAAQLDGQSRIRRKQRMQLLSTLKRFQRAAEAVPNGIVIVNAAGRVEWCNRLASKHLGLSPQKLLGSNLKKQSKLPQLAEFLAQTKQAERRRELRCHVSRKNGMKRHLLLTRVALSGKTEMLVSEDISRAEQLNATRTAFVANVSHELRTPLTVIKGFIETLNDYADLPHSERQVFLQLMDKESTRMLTLINDLLALSALEDPEQRNRREHLDFSALARQLAADGQTLSAGRHAFHTDIEDGLWVRGNGRDLYHALSNLVFNAVRYTPDAGNIRISARRVCNPNPYKAPLLRFAVADDGQGIAAEHLPHLTDRFYRVDKGRSRDSGGTGLGLAIAKHALANHDALLQIDSEPGKGSTFSTLLQTVSAPETGAKS